MSGLRGRLGWLDVDLAGLVDMGWGEGGVGACGLGNVLEGVGAHGLGSVGGSLGLG